MKRSADWSCFGTRTWLNIFSMSTENVCLPPSHGMGLKLQTAAAISPVLSLLRRSMIRLGIPLTHQRQFSIFRCFLLRGEVDTTFGQLVLVIRAR